MRVIEFSIPAPIPTQANPDAATEEVGTLKREKGCAACARRGQQVFGKWLCSIDKKPKPIYCQDWRLHEDYQ